MCIVAVWVGAYSRDNFRLISVGVEVDVGLGLVGVDRTRLARRRAAR